MASQDQTSGLGAGGSSVLPYVTVALCSYMVLYMIDCNPRYLPRLPSGILTPTTLYLLVSVGIVLSSGALPWVCLGGAAIMGGPDLSSELVAHLLWGNGPKLH